MASSQEEFIKTLIPYAKADYLKTGVLPSITIAQAIQESGWGKSGLTSNYNNLFGIKADASWTGKKVNMPTQEWNGQKMITINSYFRAYDNYGQSIRDHSDFFWKNPRYSDTLEAMKTGDYKKAVYELGKSGYATDPNYSDSLRKIIEKYDLDKLDKGETPDPSVWWENNKGVYPSNTREELENIKEKESFLDKLNPFNNAGEGINYFISDTLPKIGFIVGGGILCILGLILLLGNTDEISLSIGKGGE